MQPSKLFACLSIFIVIVLSLLPASAATNEDLAGDTASAQKPHLFQSTSLSGAAVTEPTSTNIIGEFDPVISQQAYLKASDSLPNKNFGDAVAISGNTAIVGSPRTSSVTVFVLTNNQWTQQAVLTTLNAPGFGFSVDIAGDTVVVGAPYEGSNATGVNGDQNNNNSPFAGAAYVFVRNGATWTQQAYLKASNTDQTKPNGVDFDWFGWSVAISNDTVVVGAREEDSNARGVNGDGNNNYAEYSGAAYVFVRNGTNWSQEAYLKSSNTATWQFFGEHVDVYEDTVVVSSPLIGVYVFVRNAGLWIQQAQLGGASVSIFGDTIVVGSPGEENSSGAAYVFVRDGIHWIQEARLKASNPDSGSTFGLSVRNWGDYIIANAPGEASIATGVNGNQTTRGMSQSGAAYVYKRVNGSWEQKAYLKASNTGQGDWFGGSIYGSSDEDIQIADNKIIIGAPNEDSAATTINGNQNDNSSIDSGAAYIFQIENGLQPTCAGLLQEAEDGLLTSAFTIGNDTTASGSKYLYTPATVTSFYNGTASQQKALYCFNVAEHGIYRIRGNVSGADTLSDSVYVRVDNQLSATYVWNFPDSSTFTSAYLNNSNSGLPLEIPLSQGQHFLTIYLRESGARLDTLELEKVLDSPAPPTCAGLSQEAELGAIYGGFVVSEDTSASAGKFVAAPEASGSYFTSPNATKRVDYCFSVPIDGTYQIHGTAYGADTLSDSFYVKVDDQPTSGYLWDIPTATSYVTDTVNNRGIADPVEVDLNAGNHIISIFVREDGARLDTITLAFVHPTPRPPTCAGLLQEAENGALYGSAIIGDDANASNGHYVYAPQGSASHFNGAVNLNRVDYCFNVTVAGTYRIRGNVYGIDTLSDSFYVKVDGAPTNGYLWDIATNTSYASDFVNDRRQSDPVQISLPAGQHIVSVYVREVGARLDTIELQLLYPSPQPPVCGGLTQEAENGAINGNFVIGNDQAASGGKYIHIPKGNGSSWNGPSEPHKAEYCFNVTTPGTYRIDAKVYGADDLSNSFYVQINSQPLQGYLWDTITNTSYLMDSVSNRNKLYPVIVTLYGGRNTVTFYAREDGARLDTIALVPASYPTEARSFSPIAQGIHGTLRINATGLTQEIDFTQITVSLVDAESKGQNFSQQVQADRFGQFHFDGMMPGQYVVRLVLPDGLTTSVSEVTVTATAEEASDASFDLAVQPVQEEGGNKTYLPLINR